MAPLSLPELVVVWGPMAHKLAGVVRAAWPTSPSLPRYALGPRGGHAVAQWRRAAHVSARLAACVSARLSARLVVLAVGWKPSG